MCNCIEEHEASLQKEFGDDAQITNAANIYNRQTGEEYRRMPVLRFQYYKTKPNGKKEKKSTRSWIAANYCGLCGEKLNAVQPQNTDTPQSNGSTHSGEC